MVRIPNSALQDVEGGSPTIMIPHIDPEVETPGDLVVRFSASAWEVSMWKTVVVAIPATMVKVVGWAADAPVSFPPGHLQVDNGWGDASVRLQASGIDVNFDGEATLSVGPATTEREGDAPGKGMAARSAPRTRPTPARAAFPTRGRTSAAKPVVTRGAPPSISAAAPIRSGFVRASPAVIKAIEQHIKEVKIMTPCPGSWADWVEEALRKGEWDQFAPAQVVSKADHHSRSCNPPQQTACSGRRSDDRW